MYVKGEFEGTLRVVDGRTSIDGTVTERKPPTPVPEQRIPNAWASDESGDLNCWSTDGRCAYVADDNLWHYGTEKVDQSRAQLYCVNDHFSWLPDGRFFTLYYSGAGGSTARVLVSDGTSYDLPNIEAWQQWRTCGQSGKHRQCLRLWDGDRISKLIELWNGQPTSRSFTLPAGSPHAIHMPEEWDDYFFIVPTVDQKFLYRCRWDGGWVNVEGAGAINPLSHPCFSGDKMVAFHNFPEEVQVCCIDMGFVDGWIIENSLTIKEIATVYGRPQRHYVTYQHGHLRGDWLLFSCYDITASKAGHYDEYGMMLWNWKTDTLTCLESRIMLGKARLPDETANPNHWKHQLKPSLYLAPDADQPTWYCRQAEDNLLIREITDLATPLIT